MINLNEAEKFIRAVRFSLSHRVLSKVFVGLCGGALLTSCGGDGKDSANQAAAPVSVKVITVSTKDVPLTMEFVGQTRGAIDAEIRSRVQGVIQQIHFEEGKEVKEGQLLYSIDPAPYQAKVAEAQGRVAEAETQLVKATSDLKRMRPLAEMKAVSQRQLDSSIATEGAARGSLEAAKAALESAMIELGYCKIASPITGMIGLTKAKVGEFVGLPPNPVVLNTVSKLDPIHVRFALSEKEYLLLARQKQAQLDAGEVPQKRELKMVLSDGSEYPLSGQVASIEREIDAKTGTLTVEAAFPNPQQLMRPGLFAKVRGVADTLKGAVVIPKRALRELQGQFQVYVVKPDNTTEARTVEVGVELKDDRVIQAGLKEKEIVVVDGIQRLKSGTLVKVESADTTAAS